MNHTRALIYVNTGCRPQIYTPLHLTRGKQTDRRLVSGWNMQWKYELCVKWVKKLVTSSKRIKVDFLAIPQNFEKWLLASSCLSVGPHGTTRLPMDEFSWTFLFREYFQKSVEGDLIFFSLLIRTGTLRDGKYIFSNVSSLTFWRRRFTFNSNNSPTWCNSFSVYYPEVYLQLNVFRAFSRPDIRSSMTAVAAFGFTFVSWWQSCCVRGRADRQPLVLPSYHDDSRAEFIIRPAGWPAW